MPRLHLKNSVRQIANWRPRGEKVPQLRDFAPSAPFDDTTTSPIPGNLLDELTFIGNADCNTPRLSWRRRPPCAVGKSAGRYRRGENNSPFKKPRLLLEDNVFESTQLFCIHFSKSARCFSDTPSSARSVNNPPRPAFVSVDASALSASIWRSCNTHSS